MAICPCDQPDPIDCPDIAPGLAALPRQTRSWGRIRASLLAGVAAQPALKGWTGEAEHDLGVMLLEMWAYVLDITNFYDARIADETYLGTARRDIATRRIIELLGYVPAPPMAASALLVGEVDRPEPLTLPAATGFRSEAFDAEPPQVFQTLAPVFLDPARNRWPVAPVDDPDWPGRVLMRPSEAGVPKRGVLAFTLDGAAHHASQIAGRTGFVGADGRQLAEVLLEEPVSFAAGTALDRIGLRLMGLRAGSSPLSPKIAGGVLHLDTLYPQLRADDLAVLELGDALVPFRIAAAAPAELTIEPQEGVVIPVPVSAVTLPEGVAPEGAEGWRLHFNPVRVGRLRAPAKTALTLDDLDPAVLLRPKVRQEAALSGAFLVRGAGGAGAELAGTVAEAEAGVPVFTPEAGQDDWPKPLQVPVHLYGNLIPTVRTEQVFDEVLGSADAARPGNRFKLRKAPLTWITDTGAESGRRPLIEVRVDGVLWDRVESFYGVGATERVYRLRADAKGETWVIFGDGLRGERPPTGTGNVTASYGHGGGAAKPPPGAITQTARPVKGLGRVLNPLATEGGADGESADRIRTNAPATVLTLGRAVSVQDFEALARSFNGVLNVRAGWGWHGTRQRAVVRLWVTGDGTLDLDGLRVWLLGRAAGETALAVEAAVPVAHTLALSVAHVETHVRDDVLAAVRAVLVDAETGLLAPRNLPIGGVLYRSDIVKAVHGVAGVESLTALLFDGAEMGWAMRVAAGTYADFSDGLTVE